MTVFDALVAGGDDPEDAADVLVAQLTDAELLWLLDGDTPVIPGLLAMSRRYNAIPLVAGRIDRVGLPGIRFTDGPRGVVMGASTCFPVPIARAASFDPDLERRIGEAIGKEARAQGANLFAGVCINLAPVPGWGRSQESYGEEPALLGAMGAALTRGVHPWVMSCVKHYALNSMEDARFTVDVLCEEDVLHQVYLPHFKQVVDAGVDAVMSAYNRVNGQWAGQSRTLLTSVLREQWGFGGFVMTDFVWGLRDPVASVAAGQDLEMPFRQQRAATLPDALATGRLRRADAHRAARRIVATQIRWARRAKPSPPASVVACAAHRRLAREAAVRGAVLLRNDGVLPLADQTVAVLGRLADTANLGDTGSSQVHPPSTVSVRQGLQERLGDRLLSDPGQAYVAVVVVGLGASDEGESFVATDPASVSLLGGPARSWLGSRIVGAWLTALGRLRRVGGDRADLHLSDADVNLIRDTAAVNPRTVVVVIGGGTIMCDPWDDDVAAVLIGWYPGMAGGRALADILLGDEEPGGRLPVAIPARREDLPTPDWSARQVRYGRWWGQRRLDRDGVAAAYPFGFGLGYTTWGLQADRTAEGVRVTVSNTGERDGRHVVQVYADSALIAFQPVHVPQGQQETVLLRCPPGPVRVASHAQDPDAIELS